MVSSKNTSICPILKHLHSERPDYGGPILIPKRANIR